ncbi:MAG TPA: glycosyltransferase [Verrucomicrobiota bacterium]|nr:glycosyltransferase [Verrucomicrobiota bacterium]
MSLRVLQLNTLLTGGGTDDQCVKLAAGLHRAGVEVSLAGPDGREFSAVAKRLGVPLFDTGSEGWIKLRYIAVVARLIRKHRIQIVHGHHGRDYWPTILSALCSGRRPRIVLTRHLAKSPGSWPGRWLILGLCDALVACSNFVAKVLREGDADRKSPEVERHWRPPMRGNHSKIRVIYGGFELEHFQPVEPTSPAVAAMRQSWGVDPGQFVFGVVGGHMLPRGKGQREFLAAAAQVREQVPHARFLILGRGNMGEVLEQDIARLGLAGLARLPGYCTDMPTAMNALDCVVHPQIGTEAMPGVVIEAHACGRPVIASALDGIPEAFAMGGLGELVPSEDVPALARAMEAVALRLRPTMTDRRTVHDRVAARMSLERYVSDTLALYLELLERHRSTTE